MSPLCTTTYLCKKNFFLFKKYIEEFNFERGTWNFSESYHGKGPADGVGANIKRLLDEKVAHGEDVRNASDAFILLEPATKVKLFCVTEEEIDLIKTYNDNTFNCLIAIPNTLQIHQMQVYNDDSYKVFCRIISCFCNNSMPRGFCDCFFLKKHCLLILQLPKKRLRRISYSETDTMSVIVEYESHDVQNADILQKFDSSLAGPAMFSNEEVACGPIASKKALPCENSSDSDEDIFSLNRETAPNKLTILSDVKVNYSANNIRNMMKGCSRYNVSSIAISKDFPELISNSESRKRKIDFFDSSSDNEN